MYELNQGTARAVVAARRHRQRSVQSAPFKRSGARDAIEVPDGEHIGVVLPLIERDQGVRCRYVPAAVQDKPVADDVNEYPSTSGGKLSCPHY